MGNGDCLFSSRLRWPVCSQFWDGEELTLWKLLEGPSLEPLRPCGLADWKSYPSGPWGGGLPSSAPPSGREARRLLGCASGRVPPPWHPAAVIQTSSSSRGAPDETHWPWACLQPGRQHSGPLCARLHRGGPLGQTKQFGWAWWPRWGTSECTPGGLVCKDRW